MKFIKSGTVLYLAFNTDGDFSDYEMAVALMGTASIDADALRL